MSEQIDWTPEPVGPADYECYPCRRGKCGQCSDLSCTCCYGNED